MTSNPGGEQSNIFEMINIFHMFSISESNRCSLNIIDAFHYSYQCIKCTGESYHNTSLVTWIVTKEVIGPQEQELVRWSVKKKTVRVLLLILSASVVLFQDGEAFNNVTRSMADGARTRTPELRNLKEMVTHKDQNLRSRTSQGISRKF